VRSSFRRPLSASDASRIHTLEYVYHGLNNVVHDNGRLYLAMYLQHCTISIEHSDLSRCHGLLEKPERAQNLTNRKI
jgi:glutaminase